MNLVSSAFDDKGYGGWRRAVMIALSAKNKYKFTDRSLALPHMNQAYRGLEHAVMSWCFYVYSILFSKKLLKVCYTKEV